LARDYDDDGDLDIAAISFFADYSKNQDEGFLYLKNEDGNSFKSYSLPESRAGRWLTMDAGGLDGDEKIDLVLENFSYGPPL
jgi:FG-GAP-like repeat